LQKYLLILESFILPLLNLRPSEASNLRFTRLLKSTTTVTTTDHIPTPF